MKKKLKLFFNPKTGSFEKMSNKDFKLNKMKNKNFEIEGENFIEKLFNIIAVLWIDTPIGMVISVGLLILFALIIGSGPDSGPYFFNETK
jgi:hypothetical protein